MANGITNSQINQKFLASITPQIKALILGNIARHYGISPDAAFSEVTGEEAENIMDYVTGRDRLAISIIYKISCSQGKIQTGN